MGELIDKYNEFFCMFKEFWTTVFDFKVFIGIIAIIVGFAIFVILLRWVDDVESRNKKKKMEKAISLGHVVMAERIKFWDDAEPGESPATSRYHATYRYVVNGKKYEYRYLGAKYPIEEVQMYYINNPRKVYCDYNKSNCPEIYYLLTIIVVLSIIYIVVRVIN